MSKNISLSIVIPAFNEEERILPTLHSLKNYFEETPYEHEIIVVDDGSRDNTREIVSDFSKACPEANITMVGYRENAGKGYAVRYGMLFARGDYFLFLDADGAININHVEKFWEHILEGHDVVIGSIELPGCIIIDNNEWYRRIIGKASKFLIRATATPGIYDTQRAFKMFTRYAAQEIFERQTIYGWGFDIELIVIARTLGYRIKELPVTWINPNGSRVLGISVYFKTLLELFSIVLKRMSGRYTRAKGGTFRTLQKANSTISNY